MAVKTPTNLADLPVEILQQVCSSFCMHCRGEQPSLSPGVGTLYQRCFSQRPTDERVHMAARHTLFSLCLTSKSIQAIVQPVLYHEFSIGFGSTPRAWRWRLYSFVRTMAARRDLANLVRAVLIPTALLQSVFVDEARKILLEAAGIIDLNTSAGLGQCASGLDPEKKQRELDFAPFLANYLDEKGNLTECDQTNPAWAFPVPTYDRRQTLTTEFACLLMTLLPNAQSITIESGCNLPRFGLPHPVLQGTSIASGNPTSIPDIDVSVGLQLLSIRGVQASKMKQLPNMPNLKSLHLVAMYMSQQELKNVLDRCTGKLHTFVYEASRRPANLLFAPYDYHFFPSDVGDCLANHRPSLKSLHLDLRWNWYSNQLGNTDPRLSLDLKPFISLETVLLSSDLLFRAQFSGNVDATDEDCHYIGENEYEPLTERLPQSIVSLHLVHHEGVVPPYTTKALTGLADTTRQQVHRFPNLSCVTVTPDIAPRFADGVLINKFEDCGVEFGFKAWPVSNTHDETW